MNFSKDLLNGLNIDAYLVVLGETVLRSVHDLPWVIDGKCIP